MLETGGGVWGRRRLVRDWKLIPVLVVVWWHYESRWRRPYIDHFSVCVTIVRTCLILSFTWFSRMNFWYRRFESLTFKENVKVMRYNQVERRRWHVRLSKSNVIQLGEEKRRIYFNPFFLWSTKECFTNTFHVTHVNDREIIFSFTLKICIKVWIIECQNN